VGSPDARWLVWAKRLFELRESAAWKWIRVSRDVTGPRNCESRADV